MSKSSNVFTLLLGTTAGVALGAAAIAKVLSDGEKQQEKEKWEGKKDTFDELVRNQFVCDEANGAILGKWFEDEQSICKKELLFFLAKPTKEIVKMLSIKCIPKEFDRNHHLIQAVVKKEGYKPVKIRLVSFHILCDTLKELFGNEDYIIFKGEED